MKLNIFFFLYNLFSSLLFFLYKNTLSRTRIVSSPFSSYFMNEQRGKKTSPNACVDRRGGYWEKPEGFGTVSRGPSCSDCRMVETLLRSWWENRENLNTLERFYETFINFHSNFHAKFIHNSTHRPTSQHAEVQNMVGQCQLWLYGWEEWETLRFWGASMAQHIGRRSRSKLNESAVVSQQPANGRPRSHVGSRFVACHARHQPKNLWMNFSILGLSPLTRFPSPRSPHIAYIDSNVPSFGPVCSAQEEKSLIHKNGRRVVITIPVEGKRFKISFNRWTIFAVRLTKQSNGI